MVGAGIQDGDVLVVDRSLEPVHGKIVVAVLDGELAVKRLYFKGGECRLVSENEAYKDILVEQGQDLHVWGVVAAVVRRCV
jgi:DNA polymerase V